MKCGVLHIINNANSLRLSTWCGPKPVHIHSSIPLTYGLTHASKLLLRQAQNISHILTRQQTIANAECLIKKQYLPCVFLSLLFVNTISKYILLLYQYFRIHTFLALTTVEENVMLCYALIYNATPNMCIPKHAPCAHSQ